MSVSNVDKRMNDLDDLINVTSAKYATVIK